MRALERSPVAKAPVRTDLTAASTPRESFRAFAAIWLSSVLVFLAMSLGTFSLNWSLARLPRGGSLLGSTVAFSSLVSLVVVVVVAGAIDRSDKQTLLLTMKAATACALATLLGVYLMGVHVVTITAVAVAVYVGLQSLQALYQAGTETTLADIAPDGWPGARTASLLQLQQQASRFAAPLVGGLLLTAATVWGIPAVALLGVVRGTATLLTVPASGWSRAAPAPSDQVGWQPPVVIRRVWSDARWAWVWIVERPILLYMLTVSILNSLIVLPLYSLLPAYLIAATAALS